MSMARGVAEIISNVGRNSSIQSDARFQIFVSAQMYGSGKSTLGEVFLPFLKCSERGDGVFKSVKSRHDSLWREIRLAIHPSARFNEIKKKIKELKFIFLSFRDLRDVIKPFFGDVSLLSKETLMERFANFFRYFLAGKLACANGLSEQEFHTELKKEFDNIHAVLENFHPQEEKKTSTSTSTPISYSQPSLQAHSSFPVRSRSSLSKYFIHIEELEEVFANLGLDDHVSFQPHLLYVFF